MAKIWPTDGAAVLEEKPYRVIKIESQEQPKKARLRVAAYTRVSSDSEDQLNSFAAQNRYYTELISEKPELIMVDVYADEGITGTSAEKRDDFQRMMADCRRGLVDQILVKSISRFARNTKECLQNVRELKELGVNVRFEREGINTANVSSELITAIYAAFAQKESESISGNMRWSYQRRMESGTFLPSSMAYGYKIVNKKIEIEPDAALVVCKIFQWYLDGINKTRIASMLDEEGIPTHGNFLRFRPENFPEQKNMTKSDYVIICGDFGGVWAGSKKERQTLDWLEDLPFTVLFVSGNHENFDLLKKLPVYPHLAETERAALDMLDYLMPRLAKEAGATEALKAADPMEWVGLMNNCRARAEEIIRHELIYV